MLDGDSPLLDELARAVAEVAIEDPAAQGASLSVVANLVDGWLGLEAGRLTEAQAAFDSLLAGRSTPPQFRGLAGAARAAVHLAAHRRRMARDDLDAVLHSGDLAGDPALAAACHEALAELAHAVGDDRAAFRQLRAARALDREQRAGGEAAPVVLPHTATVTRLVDLRTRELEQVVDLGGADPGSVDQLTGLSTRRRLRAVLAEVVEHRSCAVLAIDVDRFGRLNETLGHEVGDAFLVEMTDRLQRRVRDTDLVARWGGDEFVVIVPGVRDAASAIGVGEAIRRSVSSPWRPPGHEEFVPSVSIGVAVADAPGGDPDALLRQADTALERAKAKGKDRVEAFGDDLGEAATRRFEVERLIRSALDRGLFELAFQPVHSNTRGYPLTAEALLRIRLPDGQVLLPGAFLDVAEETGLARPIGTWVLRAACSAAGVWRRMGPAENFRVAVNVSAGQLDDELPELIEQSLAINQLHPDQLVLELTEHALLEANDAQVESLRRVQALGVRIALDDFGTAYSSLTHLRRFSVDVVKIDRSFVAGMAGNAEDAAIVRAIVDLSRTFEFRVIAEGIETVEQLDLQRRLGCHGAQGFLIGRPRSADIFGELLMTRAPLGLLSGLVA